MHNEILEALNDQLNLELYSAYVYQAMGAQMEEEGWEGFAHWMDMQAEEELEHARKIYDFINERGGRVELQAIDKPPFEWDSVVSAFETALEHEQKVTQSINDIVSLAREEDDYATESFLQWFVDEQVEEEDTVEGILDKMEKAGDQGMLMLDSVLGRREE
ncbi:ferritin [Halarsenatibacter silvermanii]|uniref:Ferritin n=1 Tax=Halarsenatibacter silvermanii TaxID=321763 RepID=A0A1G9NVM2_9FIRM|nr:ferritin [Halarsenatibacter silvermanii]SDL90401.1 ferritin [Halarsenatibacter silvermanii]